MRASVSGIAKQEAPRAIQRNPREVMGFSPPVGVEHDDFVQCFVVHLQAALQDLAGAPIRRCACDWTISKRHQFSNSLWKISRGVGTLGVLCMLVGETVAFGRRDVGVHGFGRVDSGKFQIVFSTSANFHFGQFWRGQLRPFVCTSSGKSGGVQFRPFQVLAAQERGPPNPEGRVGAQNFSLVFSSLEMSLHC